MINKFRVNVWERRKDWFVITPFLLYRFISGLLDNDKNPHQGRKKLKTRQTGCVPESGTHLSAALIEKIGKYRKSNKRRLQRQFCSLFYWFLNESNR